VVPVTIAGIASGVRDDHSHAWDTGYGMDENAHAILNGFFDYLQTCLENPARAEYTTALIRYLLAAARDAILWRRLLGLAARFPAIAQQIGDAASAQPLLLASDTQRAPCTCLSKYCTRFRARRSARRLKSPSWRWVIWMNRVDGGENTDVIRTWQRCATVPL